MIGRQKMLFNRSILSILFPHSVKRKDNLFENIYGCDDIKKLFGMALDSNDTCPILLTGPPASAKTLFLQSLVKLKDSHFIDCSSATNSGVVDYIFIFFQFKVISFISQKSFVAR